MAFENSSFYFITKNNSFVLTYENVTQNIKNKIRCLYLELKG